MASLPVEVLIGLSFGLLIGIVPAFAVGGTSFLLTYYGDGGLSRFAVVAIALPLVAVNGYLVGVVEGDLAGEPAVIAATLLEQVPRLMVAALIAVMLALYANSQGEKLAADLPTDLSRATKSERTLSAEAIDDVDGMGQVTVRAAGEVRDMEGYPPLSPDERSALEDGAWRLPADLPLSELETRLADRLRTEHDFADVSVSVDARGRAAIAAAPASKDLARRVPDGHRAVSLTALLPTGLSPGDEVLVAVGDDAVSARVLSTDTGGESVDPTDGDEPAAPEGGRQRPGTESDGGRGRVTVAVPTADAGTLLHADAGRVVATSHDTSRAFEAFSLLERAGRSVRKVALDPDRRETLDGALGEGGVRLLAVRERDATDNDGGWRFDPDGDALDAAEAAFVVGGPASGGLTPAVDGAGGDGR